MNLCVCEWVCTVNLNMHVHLHIKKQEYHSIIFILYCSLIKAGIVLAVVKYSLNTSVSDCFPAVWLFSLHSNCRLVLVSRTLSLVTVSESVCLLGSICFYSLTRCSFILIKNFKPECSCIKFSLISLWMRFTAIYQFHGFFKVFYFLFLMNNNQMIFSFSHVLAWLTKIIINRQPKKMNDSKTVRWKVGTQLHIQNKVFFLCLSSMAMMYDSINHIVQLFGQL